MSRLEDLTTEQKQRLVDYVGAYLKLSDMPARELVNLALEHLRGTSNLQDLLVEELCTRVHPTWTEEE